MAVLGARPMLYVEPIGGQSLHPSGEGLLDLSLAADILEGLAVGSEEEPLRRIQKLSVFLEQLFVNPVNFCHLIKIVSGTNA